jgi:hypothetical protein
MKNHKYIKVKIYDLQDLHGGAFLIKKLGEYASTVANNAGPLINTAIKISGYYLVGKEVIEIWKNKEKHESDIIFFQIINLIAESKYLIVEVEYQDDGTSITKDKLSNLINWIEEKTDGKLNFQINEYEIKSYDKFIYFMKEVKKIYDNILLNVLIISATLIIIDAYSSFLSNLQSDNFISFEQFTSKFGLTLEEIIIKIVKYSLITANIYLSTKNLNEKIKKFLKKLDFLNNSKKWGFMGDFNDDSETPALPQDNATANYIFFANLIRYITQFIVDIPNYFFYIYEYSTETFGNQEGGAKNTSYNYISILKYINNSKYLGKRINKIISKSILIPSFTILFRLITKKMLIFGLQFSNLLENKAYTGMIGNIYDNAFNIMKNNIRLQNYISSKINLTKYGSRFSKYAVNQILDNYANFNKYTFNASYLAPIAGLASIYLAASTISTPIIVGFLIVMATLIIPNKNIYNSIYKIEDYLKIKQSEGMIVDISIEQKQKYLINIIPEIFNRISKVKSAEEFKNTAIELIDNSINVSKKIQINSTKLIN